MKMRLAFTGYIFLGILYFGSLARANCTLEFQLTGAIGPATLDWVERAEQSALSAKCESVLVLINTPGGNLQSTRMIVERILNAEIPYLCLIAPSGAHAGSAGAVIMQACHVSGGLSATNIGAATPVAGGGQKLEEDMRNKMINDTRSWVLGLAKLRGRSESFAKDIVEKAEALPAEDAFSKKAIDWVGSTKEDFLEFSRGRQVKMADETLTSVEVGPLVVKEEDLRHKVMDFVTNPQIAYFLFMGSLGLLYFELTHPGMIAPGVLGAIGLGISLVAMHMLDVTTGGLVLLFLGLILMVLEVFVTSFGVLGIGGVVSFFLGSLFLFDPEVSGVSLSLGTILPATILLALFMSAVLWLALSTRKRRSQSDFGALEGKVGHVTFLAEDKLSGQVSVNGEIWKFKSQDQVQLNDSVKVREHKGFTLLVIPHKED